MQFAPAAADAGIGVDDVGAALLISAQDLLGAQGRADAAAFTPIPVEVDVKKLLFPGLDAFFAAGQGLRLQRRSLFAIRGGIMGCHGIIIQIFLFKYQG
jgi:hypothetical protein